MNEGYAPSEGYLPVGDGSSLVEGETPEGILGCALSTPSSSTSCATSGGTPSCLRVWRGKKLFSYKRRFIRSAALFFQAPDAAEARRLKRRF